jgi:hypothetical protein
MSGVQPIISTRTVVPWMSSWPQVFPRTTFKFTEKFDEDPQQWSSLLFFICGTSVRLPLCPRSVGGFTKSQPQPMDNRAWLNRSAQLGGVKSMSTLQIETCEYCKIHLEVSRVRLKHLHRLKRTNFCFAKSVYRMIREVRSSVLLAARMQSNSGNT